MIRPAIIPALLLCAGVCLGQGLQGCIATHFQREKNR